MTTVLHKSPIKTNVRGKEEEIIVPKCVRVAQTGRVAQESPFANEEWCKKTVSIKVASGAQYNKEGEKFADSVMIGSDKESSSDTDEEGTIYNSKMGLTASNKFRFTADLKKRKQPAGVFAAPGQKLPEDVDVLLEDMDRDMQLIVIECVKESINKYPDVEDMGAQRAKQIKQLLDERLEHCWHCCVIIDKFWAGCSFQPGYTFAFELNDLTYLVWRTPSLKNPYL